MPIARSTVGPTLAVTGVVLQLALVVVLFKISPIAATLMVSGIGDPSSLVGGILGEIIPYCAVELTLALLGLVLLGFALVFNRYRARWFFRFLIVYGVVLLPILPVGTVFGAFFLFYNLTHRREFAYSLPKNKIGP